MYRNVLRITSWCCCCVVLEFVVVVAAIDKVAIFKQESENQHIESKQSLSLIEKGPCLRKVCTSIYFQPSVSRK